jgi:hypothetical protein
VELGAFWAFVTAFAASTADAVRCTRLAVFRFSVPVLALVALLVDAYVRVLGVPVVVVFALAGSAIFSN